VYESEFLTNSPESRTSYQEWMARAIDELCRHLPAGPYSGKTAASLRQVLGGVVAEDRCSPDELWKHITAIVSESVAVTHPNTAAHLHCPPLIPALAAEVILTALNQSMDSFDQAPAATVLEEKIVRWLCDETGLPSQSGGVFTAGGTQSNYMALLLARDAAVERHFHWSVKKQGLPNDARKLRILCSEVAHFTVEKSASQLGLGTDAVVRVASDENFRMSVDALARAIGELQARGLIPMAVVGTAGTTDFGSIDPLPQIAPLAQSAGAWFHIDAAYGSALLFSHLHRAQLQGINSADSVSMDFHKLLWQPISCAAFLLRNADHFRYLKLHADYLNPESHEERGVPNLVTRSLATTRRFDALKLWVSLQAIGRTRLGEMIDATLELAAHAADFIRRSVRLEVVHEPMMGCVVFRYCPANSAIESNAFNADLQQRLFERGIAVIGHTIVRGRQYLKLTCMNPCTSKQQIAELIELVVEHGRELEKSRTPE